MSSSYNVRVIDNRSDKDERMYCDICSYPIMSGQDFTASKRYSCCHDCFLLFIEARRDNWKKGDRPKQKMVDSYIETKDKLSHKSRSIE